MAEIKRQQNLGSLCLSGCWLLEKAILVPEINFNIPYNTELINKQALEAVNLAVKDVKAPGLWWAYDITYLDVLEGTLETGYFKESNMAGISLRAQIDRKNNVIVITIKGAGPYYSDLPVDKAKQYFSNALICELNKMVTIHTLNRSHSQQSINSCEEVGITK
jgi:hypothetical protein